MEQENNVPTGADSQAEEYVEITEASREDLRAAREKFLAEEWGDNTQTQQKESEPQQAQVQPQNPPVTSRETQSAQPESSTVQKEKPVQYSPEEIQRIATENERLRKEGEQRELYLQRRNTEFGEIRKKFRETVSELEATKKLLSDGLRDQFQEDPVEALKTQRKIEEIDNQINNVQGEEQRLQRINDSQAILAAHVDLSQINVDDLAEPMESDGIDPRFIASFRNNPYEFMHPEALVQLGKRAVERKALAAKQNDLMLVAKYAKSLEDKIKQLEGKPTSVVNNLQKHLNQLPPITPMGNGSSAVEPNIFKEPHLMSKAERAEYLRKNNEAS